MRKGTLPPPSRGLAWLVIWTKIQVFQAFALLGSSAIGSAAVWLVRGLELGKPRPMWPALAEPVRDLFQLPESGGVRYFNVAVVRRLKRVGRNALVRTGLIENDALTGRKYDACGRLCPWPLPLCGGARVRRWDWRANWRERSHAMQGLSQLCDGCHVKHGALPDRGICPSRWSVHESLLRGSETQTSPDAQEGLKAFLQNAAPKFQVTSMSANLLQTFSAGAAPAC